jgi:hypothetical protein
MDTDDKPNESAPAKRESKKVKLSNLVHRVKVTLDDGRFVMVPVGKAAYDSTRSVLVAKTTDFLQEQLDKMKDKTLTPAEVRDVVKAVADMDALLREQCVTQLNNNQPSSDAPGVAGAIVKGATQGVATAFMEKMEQMDRAAKQIKSAEKVDADNVTDV